MKLISKNQPGGKVWKCPMKCEGEKTYNSPGNCPVCNMKLLPVQGLSPDHKNDKTHKHHHNGCC
jgi:Cu2+-exporting ATPase